jgi:hypothetical protein
VRVVDERPVLAVHDPVGDSPDPARDDRPVLPHCLGHALGVIGNAVDGGTNDGEMRVV